VPLYPATALASDRLEILDDGEVLLDFKRPWFDNMSSIELSPLTLIARSRLLS
jgi:hypothetical protein